MVKCTSFRNQNSKECFFWVFLSVVAAAAMSVTFVSLVYKYHGGFDMFEFSVGMAVGVITTVFTLPYKGKIIALLKRRSSGGLG